MTTMTTVFMVSLPPGLSSARRVSGPSTVHAGRPGPETGRLGVPGGFGRLELGRLGVPEPGRLELVTAATGRRAARARGAAAVVVDDRAGPDEVLGLADAGELQPERLARFGDAVALDGDAHRLRAGTGERQVARGGRVVGRGQRGVVGRGPGDGVGQRVARAGLVGDRELQRGVDAGGLEDRGVRDAEARGERRAGRGEGQRGRGRDGENGGACGGHATTFAAARSRDRDARHRAGVTCGATDRPTTYFVWRLGLPGT